MDAAIFDLSFFNMFKNMKSAYTVNNQSILKKWNLITYYGYRPLYCLNNNGCYFPCELWRMMSREGVGGAFSLRIINIGKVWIQIHA